MIKVSPVDTGPSRVLTHLSEDQMPYKKRRSKPFQVQNSDTEQENGDAEKTCCVCEEIIMDTGRKKQAAVFCDGICQRWLHRSCAGLSVPWSFRKGRGSILLQFLPWSAAKQTDQSNRYK